jgi:hypothetical protein
MMIMAELLLGRPMNDMTQPNYHQDMTAALTLMHHRCAQQNLCLAQQATGQFLEYHNSDDLRDQLTTRERIHPSLVLKLVETTECPTELWEEDSIASPFPPGWMHAVWLCAADRQVHSIAFPQAKAMFTSCIIHKKCARLGYTNGHHFRITYPYHELKTNLCGLLINICNHLATDASETAALLPSLPQ